MGLREWAIKPGDLKPLPRGGLILFAARCALRVEPWIPDGTAALWADNLAFVVAVAFAEPADRHAVEMRRRAVSDAGAIACDRLNSTDEPLGRCMSYATQTLASALDVTLHAERPAVAKEAIVAAKLSASIAAVWAHAGRVRVSAGTDAVDVACTTTWAAIREDIASLAAALRTVEASADRVQALRGLAPLWPGGAPSWSAPAPARGAH